jgi:hypothetical protein
LSLSIETLAEINRVVGVMVLESSASEASCAKKRKQVYTFAKIFKQL